MPFCLSVLKSKTRFFDQRHAWPSQCPEHHATGWWNSQMGNAFSTSICITFARITPASIRYASDSQRHHRLFRQVKSAENSSLSLAAGSSAAYPFPTSSARIRLLGSSNLLSLTSTSAVYASSSGVLRAPEIASKVIFRGLDNSAAGTAHLSPSLHGLLTTSKFTDATRNRRALDHHNIKSRDP